MRWRRPGRNSRPNLRPVADHLGMRQAADVNCSAVRWRAGSQQRARRGGCRCLVLVPAALPQPLQPSLPPQHRGGYGFRGDFGQLERYRSAGWRPASVVTGNVRPVSLTSYRQARPGCRSCRRRMLPASSWIITTRPREVTIHDHDLVIRRLPVGLATYPRPARLAAIDPGLGVSVRFTLVTDRSYREHCRRGPDGCPGPVQAV